MRSAVLATLGLFLAGCVARGPAPAPLAVEPGMGVAGQAVDVVIHGGFRPLVQLDFDRPSSSVVATSFDARLGDTPLEHVVWLDGSSLRATVPPSLAVGTWDLTVTDPRGERGTLAGAFSAYRLPEHLVIETRAGGVGAAVDALSLRLASQVPLHAVARDPAGAYVRDAAEAIWSVDGVIGTVLPVTGAATTFTADTAGEGQVRVSAPGLPGDDTGLITVTACGGAADCADACHSSASCVAGQCVFSAADKDSDHDGFVDAACVGGLDCDDGDAQVHPGAQEGPYQLATCRDGKDNDCDGFTDGADRQCAQNSAPLAVATVSPPVGAPGAVFTADSAGTTDREQSAAALRYEWDWDGDGVYESTGPTSTHAFAQAGVYHLALKVTDPFGLVGVASAPVVVAAPSDTAVVTTGVDELDPGATPSNPRGSGLSLREALGWAAATPGQQAVVVLSGLTVHPTVPQLVLGTTPVIIVGFGAVVDCAGISGAGASCLDVSGGAHQLFGLEVRNARGWAVWLHGTGAQVSGFRVHDNGSGVQVAGQDNVLGPGNELWATGSPAVEVSARSLLVDNLVRNNPAVGIEVRNGGDDTRLIGNRLVANGGDAVSLAAQARRVRVWHNTVHGNGGSGLATANSTGDTDLRNNVFTANTAWGVDAAASNLAAANANDFWANGQGACRACGPMGPLTLTADPRYLAAPADLRPDLFSPVVNAGEDLGVDRNGPLDGGYLGPAPDQGAFEVW